MAQVQNGAANHGTAYFAHEQTAGKGQRGKSWTTNTGENIILSVVIQAISSISVRFIFCCRQPLRMPVMIFLKVMQEKK